MKKKILFLFLVLCTMLSCDRSKDAYVLNNLISIDGFLHSQVVGYGSSVIVNSKEQLQQKLPNGYEEYSKMVDFSRNNMLLIYGTSDSGVYDIVKKQIKVDGNYHFEITVHQNGLTVIDSWCVAYIIPKDVTMNNIGLQITYKLT